MKKLTVRNSLIGFCVVLVAVAVPLWVNTSSAEKLTTPKSEVTKLAQAINVTPEKILVEEIDPDVDLCDCEFAGLQEAYATVEKVYYDKKTDNIMAITNSAILGRFTTSLTPQHNETFAEMVKEYTGQEIVIGFVGDAKDHDTVEVTWALLTTSN
jgi:hypothetical protein